MSGRGAWASAPTVAIPSAFRCSLILGPTPQSACTSCGQNTPRKLSSVSAVMPRGLVTPLAILAMSLLGPTPIEAPSACVSRMRACSSRAIAAADSSVWPRSGSRSRSRNASSTLNGSTSGVIPRNISSSSSDFSTYLRGLPSTYSAPGHSRFASASGMPACTPNGRASYEATVTTPRRLGSPHTITGLPRRCGWCACSTEAKNASMSTSRIMPCSLAWPGPGPAQDPRWPARVVAELVAVVARALDREVAEHGLPLAPRPLTRDAAHAHHPPLPAEADGTNGTVYERGQHVHGIVQGFEHGGSRRAPRASL